MIRAGRLLDEIVSQAAELDVDASALTSLELGRSALAEPHAAPPSQTRTQQQRLRKLDIANLPGEWPFLLFRCPLRLKRTGCIDADDVSLAASRPCWDAHAESCLSRPRPRPPVGPGRPTAHHCGELRGPRWGAKGGTTSMHWLALSNPEVGGTATPGSATTCTGHVTYNMYELPEYGR